MAETLDPIFKVQLFTTLMMAGVLWLVQLVHYPLFRGIDPVQFKEWHQYHSSMISFIVVPLMVLELLSAIGLLFGGALQLLEGSPHLLGGTPHLVERWKLITLLGLTLVIWGSTFLLSVPLHGRLSQGFDLKVVNQLVLTNWPRTIAASVKVLLLYYWL